MRCFSVVTLVSLSLFFPSCDSEKEWSVSKVELLSGTWKLTALTQVESKATRDVYRDFDNCVKDNLYVYSNDFTYQFLEGETLCNPEHPFAQGVWSFSHDEIYLRLHGADTDPTVFVIEKLDKITLQLLLAQVDIGSEFVDLHYTYIKQ